MLTTEPQRVAIIGGGISGLSAAYYVMRTAEAMALAVRVLVIEGEERLGGKIRTDLVGGDHQPFLIEGGPDAFLAQKPSATDLARELGLADQFIGTASLQPATSIVVHGQPQPLPAGLRLITPTRLLPFLASPVISPGGKAQMLLDLVKPARKVQRDESLASFVRARLGTEALDRLAEPLMAGIYNADPEEQSMLATFPQFRSLEAQHGSIIRGARRLATGSANATRAAGTSSSAFLTLRGGMGRLVGALATQLDGCIWTGRRVLRIRPVSRPRARYELVLDDGNALDADSVVVTTPAFVAADLIESWQLELATNLRRIPYVSTGTISLAYHKEDIRRPFAGFGLVIPHVEHRFLNAITICSEKFIDRAPPGQVLLRLFFGGFRNQHLVDEADTTLLQLAERELFDLLGITAPPRFARIYRWRNASPQYCVGHLDLVKEIASSCPSEFRLCGSAYGGVGIPDCVRQAKSVAEQVVQGLLKDSVSTAS
ncbi:MAG: protoporphyrinogen oxidase [Ktedonobacterales bacterium]